MWRRIAKMAEECAWSPPPRLGFIGPGGPLNSQTALFPQFPSTSHHSQADYNGLSGISLSAVGRSTNRGYPYLISVVTVRNRRSAWTQHNPQRNQIVKK